MRLFVSEFICGGGWSGSECPPSLVREGAAMLRAFVGDVLRISGMRVVTTWDCRLSIELGITSESLEVIEVSDANEEREVFARLCRDADASYVIAPELHDELSRRVTVASGSGNKRPVAGQMTPACNLNCSVEAINLCGDKWAMYEHLAHCGIPTIPTSRVGVESDTSAFGWPRVLKLRQGAGSQAMQLVTSPADWEQATSRYDSSNRCAEAIAQPYIRGIALSMGAIVDRSGTVQLLPVADQWIDPEQGFAYLGGRIPSDRAIPRNIRGANVERTPTTVPSRPGGPEDDPTLRLVRDTLSTIPGLQGYVGVDLLNPQSPALGTPLIVEINPRLTTSYVGYQRLCLDNLAALWIGNEAHRTGPRWRPGQVEFNSAGEFR